MKSSVEKFLTQSEEQEIVATIREAEKQTSGEIRVHLEATHQGELMDRAKKVFHMLKMDQTKLENGVLIYVAIEDHKFAIYGGAGIHKIVASNFWESTKNSIQKQFKAGAFKQGLIDGITLAGSELKTYFPSTRDDENELPDQISK